MSKSSGEIHGVQIGADELKLEHCMHWKPCKNVILGIFHEHSEWFGLEFCSMAQAYTLRDSIQNGFIHLASEATVLAVMVFSDDPHLCSAQPFVISGMCKHKDVNSQQELLETACTAMCQKLWDIRLQLYSIASDGDSRQCLTTANLTLIWEIVPDSELWSQLRDLALFNNLCGAYEAHNPLGSFWLSLPGTDSLKGFFGKVWTIQSNDSNVDQLQLVNHIDSAVICTNILKEHPEWD
ncbi:hypothetical protein PILCRDRAFT_91242 [Piloderma croceum F 1598]|uniref:Uncharacterized protein n=1 Tax=Piloderma croceum (strain F 1598) TaxID=765440 RepID=A0A0C3ATE7_PILCF|nr:hypothetical protein PILCRDRAFT_91242 [Piloderma croceum F 1598]